MLTVSLVRGVLGKGWTDTEQRGNGNQIFDGAALPLTTARNARR